MYALIIALLGLVLAAPAQAQAHVDIGIYLPAPPRFVVIPQVPAVHYIPAAPGNLFVYDGQYWIFANGGWYVSTAYSGPWIAIPPHFVPRPILLVPVGYYHVRPGHWQKWAHHHPPRWHDEWGREWAKRRAWRHGDRDDDDDDRRRGRSRGDDDDRSSKGRRRGRD
jgi:hypothetical protein